MYPIQTKPILIRGGRVHDAVTPGAKAVDLLLQNGKIAAIGAGLTAPDGCETVDAAGLDIWPGFVDAHTHIGATRNLLYLSDGSLLVSIREGTRMLQHLRKLRLCVDVWYRNVCVETAEEIQLSEHRTFRRRRENQ